MCITWPVNSKTNFRRNSDALWVLYKGLWALAIRKCPFPTEASGLLNGWQKIAHFLSQPISGDKETSAVRAAGWALDGNHDSRKVKRPLCRSWFRLNRESSLLPCLQSALKSPHVLVSTLLKFLRQTGARALVWSSAVRHDGFVLGDTGKVFFELV
jgi:hypothetical protein